MPGRRRTVRSRSAPTQHRVAELEQENARLRQMYLKLSLEHSALQEMVLAVAMRQGATTEQKEGRAGSAAPLPGSKGQ